MTDTVDAFLAECADLDGLVANLDDAEWRQDTPAAGWTIAHQIAHLAWTDEVALTAATDPSRFDAVIAEALADPDGYVDQGAEAGVQVASSDLLARWRRSREGLAEALRTTESGTKIPWFGPPMSPRSMATARLMETWAHGQDVADALGIERVPTDRLRDVAHLGVRTRDFAYVINGLAAPASEFRIELTAPSGAVWTWGPENVEPDVTGPALDFCLVVTQRRPFDTSALLARGESAHWLTFAQAFAGQPTRMEPR